MLDTHLHLLVYIDLKRAKRWSKRDVLRRWARLCPPRGPDRKPLPSIEKWVQSKLSDHKFINTVRKRLVDLGWFMKSLKEPLARQANQEDGTHGAFWAARYQSIAVLDEEALLATCAYIDLNPLAAGCVKLPELARYTSLWVRVDWCRRQGRLSDLQAGALDRRWGRRRRAGWSRVCGSARWTIVAGEVRRGWACWTGFRWAVTCCWWTRRAGCCVRARRGVGPEVTALLTRLGTTPEVWQVTMQHLFSRPRLLGVAFAFHRKNLREAAAVRGCHHLANLNGCPA